LGFGRQPFGVGGEPRQVERRPTAATKGGGGGAPLFPPALPTYPPAHAADYAFHVPAGMRIMRQLQHIKARVIRLCQLTANLGKEVNAQRHAECLLLPQERRLNLDGLQDGLVGLDATTQLQEVCFTPPLRFGSRLR
jgi:hypothetical protein